MEFMRVLRGAYSAMSYDIGTFKLRERHAESVTETRETQKETRQGTGDFTRLNSYPPGVLATKVGYFGVKSTKVPQGQMGT